MRHRVGCAETLQIIRRSHTPQFDVGSPLEAGNQSIVITLALLATITIHAERRDGVVVITRTRA